MFRAPPPERRRRGDLVAAAVLVAALAGAAVAVGLSSDVAGTAYRPADAPITAPPVATGVPTGFAVAWSTPSAGTPTPVVAGPAVVTADDDTVVGRDARTGVERWSYRRDVPLCTVGTAFPGIAEGRVLALYANDSGPVGPGDGPYCSELTMLRADTGERVGARNPDTRPGTRLTADDTYALAAGEDHLEVLRSDLVRTLEYGAVPAQEQVGRQPRPDCGHRSAVVGGGLVGVVERCPGESGDRLTVLAADGEDGSEQPEEKYSVLLPGSGAAVVALTDERAAVTLGGRLLVFDVAGAQVVRPALDGPVCDDPDAAPRFVRVGSSVLALDPCTLAPRWTLPDTLGDPVGYGVDLLVPVPGGLRVVDAGDGTAGRVLPVDRPDPAAPVALAVQGEVLLEQRGADLVALVPVSS